MTALQISNPKLSFLQKIVGIHFPENVHMWTATAFVAAQIFAPAGGQVVCIITTIKGTFNTDVGLVYDAAVFPNPFAIPIRLPSDISIASWFKFHDVSSGHDFWLPEVVDVSDSKSEFSAHPVAFISASFTILCNGHTEVDASATGVTAGNPRGDSSFTASATKTGNLGDTLTVVGSASASAGGTNAGVTVS